MGVFGAGLCSLCVCVRPLGHNFRVSPSRMMTCAHCTHGVRTRAKNQQLQDFQQMDSPRHQQEHQHLQHQATSQEVSRHQVRRLPSSPEAPPPATAVPARSSEPSCKALDPRSLQRIPLGEADESPKRKMVRLPIPEAMRGEPAGNFPLRMKSAQRDNEWKMWWATWHQ